MLRTEKGITLVALIITIIILVILAAVSITAVTQTGLLDTATNGVGNYAKEQEIEKSKMDSYVDFTSKALQSIDAIINPKSTPSTPSTPEA